MAAVETAKSFNCAAVRVNVGVGVEGGGGLAAAAPTGLVLDAVGVVGTPPLELLTFN